VHTQPQPLITTNPHIAFVSPQPDPDRELQSAARELARMVADAGASGRTKIHVGFGDAEKSVLEIAERETATLIIIGSRRRAQTLMARAPCPVLVVPRDKGCASAERGEEDDAAGSIVCGVDDSADARLALRVAAQLSAQLEARLVVAHVVQVPIQPSRLAASPLSPMGVELEAGCRLLENVLEEEGLSDAEQRVEYGVPARRLADLADEEGAELIVVGSRGRGPFKAALLGSVSTKVIDAARCQVLVVPAGAAAQLGRSAHGALRMELPSRRVGPTSR